MIDFLSLEDNASMSILLCWGLFPFVLICLKVRVSLELWCASKFLTVSLGKVKSPDL